MGIYSMHKDGEILGYVEARTPEEAAAIWAFYRMGEKAHAKKLSILRGPELG